MSNRSRLDMERSYLIEHLEVLREHYQRQAQPYIDRLIEIDSCRMPAVTVAVGDDGSLKFETVEMR